MTQRSGTAQMFPDPMDAFRGASRALESSPEWLALRSEEDRLEADLREVKERKRALIETTLDSLPEYP